MRKLSPHVITRWYRCPEVILLEPNYEYGVDVWSLGCVLSELLYCSEPYLSEAKVEADLLNTN